MVADQLQEEKIWRGKLGRSSAAGSSSAPIENTRTPPKPPNPAQLTATGIDATSRKIFEHLPLAIGGGGGGGQRRRALRVGCGSVLLPSPPKYKGRIEMKKADWDTKVQIFACMAKISICRAEEGGWCSWSNFVGRSNGSIFDHMSFIWNRFAYSKEM